VKTPDTTTAQIVSIIGAVVGLAVAFALVDDKTGQAVIGAASVIVPSAYLLADSIIRNGRARSMQAPTQISIAPAPSGPSAGINPSGATPIDDPADAPVEPGQGSPAGQPPQAR
jgi:hypothetical protein